MSSKSKEWRPVKPCGYAPVFVPSQWSLTNFFNYFFGYPGFFAPWNVIYFLTCLISHTYTTPAIEDCKEFKFGWVAQLFVRNEVLLWIFAGGWHVLLYMMKVQGKDGMDRKYDKKWPGGGAKFMFGHQTYENVFMSSISGVLVWTFYEAIFMKLWATNRIPHYRNMADYPLWTLAQLILIPFWREFHFYWIHRMSHWKPIYKHVHSLHHKNVNPGPWSGLSMHPVEHILYFSVMIPHMLVFGHPIHLFFNAQHTALTPASGHHGFDAAVVDGKIPTGSYFHYLHHRYFECNYGEGTIPLDRWFGSFRDGTPDGEGAKTSVKAGIAKEQPWVLYTTLAVGSVCSVVPLVPFVAAAL